MSGRRMMGSKNWRRGFLTNSGMFLTTQKTPWYFFGPIRSSCQSQWTDTFSKICWCISATSMKRKPPWIHFNSCYFSTYWLVIILNADRVSRNSDCWWEKHFNRHVTGSALVMLPTWKFLGPLRWWLPWKLQAAFSYVARLMGKAPCKCFMKRDFPPPCANCETLVMEKYTDKEAWNELQRLKKK